MAGRPHAAQASDAHHLSPGRRRDSAAPRADVNVVDVRVCRDLRSRAWRRVSDHSADGWGVVRHRRPRSRHGHRADRRRGGGGDRANAGRHPARSLWQLRHRFLRAGRSGAHRRCRDRTSSSAPVGRRAASPEPLACRVATFMRITDAKVIICSPGRNFVTLKLVTEDGVYGLGDATLNGRELAVACYLTDHVIPLLINRDARRIEDMWQYLYKGAYWRRGPVTMSAISAVDTALWDILGKTLNTPVYQLLGGASRDSVMVYGHANGSTPDETVKAVQEYMGMGYRAVRAQCAIPGVVNAYGVGRGTMYYEPAQKGMPLESIWSTERYLDFVPLLFE